MKLIRTSYNKVISGVCGGIARYFNMDATLMRVIFIAVSLFTGLLPLLIAYIIMSFVIPKDDFEEI